MRDLISIERVSLLHPAIRDEVATTIDAIEANFNPNMKVRIVQGLRTIAEQNALYAQGRTAKGKIVTNARGGSSYHNYGLAIDFALMYDKDGNGSFETLSWDIHFDFDHDKTSDWDEVVKPFQDKGYTWGGEFHSLKDYPHLEKTFGFNWRDLFKKYQDKDFIPGTEYVNFSLAL